MYVGGSESCTICQLTEAISVTNVLLIVDNIAGM